MTTKPVTPMTRKARSGKKTAAIVAAGVAISGFASVWAAAETDYLQRWWAPGSGGVLPAAATYPNEHGAVTTISENGPFQTDGHPFFTPLGNHRRACVTCHQPADGMSISVETARARWRDTQGKDPLFAAVDGSNCPALPQELESSHSLLLDRGLIRIFRPWPPKDADGKPIKSEFTIEVVRDPTGCNTSPVYGLKSAKPTISVYRRPRAATNIKFLTIVGYTFEPKFGMPLPVDAETGLQLSGNLMADSRAGTPKAQAIDALLNHLERHGDPDKEELKKIVDFESQIYTAQSHDRWGSPLTEAGAHGGPEFLAQQMPGVLPGSLAKPDVVWSEFQSWKGLPKDPNASEAQEAQRQFRESVARGAEVFVKKTFLVRDSAGITNMSFGNPIRNTCAFCHNMARTGMDIAPGQVDLGTTNEPYADPSPELPLFKLTCGSEFKPHPHLLRVVYTQDPGFALTTGRCVDIGKITMQDMRGLAARPPYFSNGSAKTLRAIVDFYDRRYNIGYTEQEKQDLTNLMSVL